MTPPPGGGSGSKRPKISDNSGGNALLAKNRFAALANSKDEGLTVPKKEKLPPFFTACKDIASLQQLLKEKALTPVFKLCSQGTKIICSSMDEYAKTGQLLHGAKLEFYTHDIPASRPFKVVIRGLPDFSVEDIKQELVYLKLKPIKVFKMTRKDQMEKNYRDHLVLVHFEKGTTTLKQLQEIRAILQVVVRWEAYRGSSRPVTQCKNCLGFGHGTKNCYLRRRCLNCGTIHEKPEDCKAATKCANCSGDHLSTEVSCPARNEFIEVRKKASRPKKNERAAASTLDLGPMDFPNLTATPPAPPPAAGPSASRQANRPSAQQTPVPGFQQVSPKTSPHQRAQDNPGQPIRKSTPS